MSFHFARRLGLLVLTAATVTPVARAQTGAAYSPGKLRYHVLTVLSRSQPLGGGRAPFDFTTTTHEWIGIDVGTATHDTLPIEMTVDSIRITSTLDAPPWFPTTLRGPRVPPTPLARDQGEYSHSNVMTPGSAWPVTFIVTLAARPGMFTGTVIVVPNFWTNGPRNFVRPPSAS